MERIVWIVLFSILVSCKASKNIDKKEHQTTVTDSFIRKSVRIGDTVRFTVPKFNFKDTTIYSVNRQGTTLKTVFNENGNVSEIECLSSRIDELVIMNRELMRSLSEKQKTEQIQPDKWFWVIVLFVGFLVFIVSRKLGLI